MLLGSADLESEPRPVDEGSKEASEGSAAGGGRAVAPAPPSPPPFAPPPGAFNPSVYDNDHVFLALEFMSDAQGRWMVWQARVAVAIGTASLGVEIWWRYGSDTQYVLYGTASSILSVSVGAAGLAALLAAGALFARGVLAARAAGKKFGVWRRRYCTMAAAALAFETCSLTFFLAPNALDLAAPCSWTQPAVQALSYLRWTSIAALLSLQVVQGLAVVPLRGKHPWGVFLPRRTLIAAFLAAFLPMSLVHFFRLALATGWFTPGYACTKYFGQSCDEVAAAAACQNRAFSCVYTSAEVAVTSTYVAMALIVIAIYFVCVAVARARVAALPYARRRLVSIELGLQLQARVPAAAFFVVGFIVLGFIRMDSCSSMMLTIMGHPSFQIAMASVAAMQVLLAAPAVSDASALRLRPWLQDFAWLEAEVGPKAAARPPAVRDEPCFCFETCLKCFYFARVAYRLDPDGADAAPPFSVPVALGLYGLAAHAVIWRRKEEAKCLAAWDVEKRVLVLAFRGTASMANVAADLEVWRRVYPAGAGSWLGGQPMVHRGFWRTWEGSGLKGEVMGLVKGLVGADAAGWRVLVTGHSLGASLASLAAFDVALAWGPRLRLTMVGFGPPRTGNHAYARAFARAVPDAWAVFHGEDAVSQAGKFVFLYKREAHVVLVSPRGELIVRPSYAEAALRRGTPSVAMHQLSAYARSVGAILRSAAGLRGAAGNKSARRGAGTGAGGDGGWVSVVPGDQQKGRAAWDAGAETNAEEKAALRELLASAFVQAALTGAGAMRLVSVLRAAGASASMIERAQAEEDAAAEAAAAAAAAEAGSMKPARSKGSRLSCARCLSRTEGDGRDKRRLQRVITGVRGAMGDAVAAAAAAANEVGPLMLNAEEKVMQVED